MELVQCKDGDVVWRMLILHVKLTYQTAKKEPYLVFSMVMEAKKWLYLQNSILRITLSVMVILRKENLKVL